jgi:hypothetical protein
VVSKTLLRKVKIVTQEDQDAIVGKARREYREKKKELAAIEARGSEMAAIALNLARGLNAPEQILIVGEQGISGVNIGRANAVIFPEPNFQKISLAEVEKHVKEYKEVKNRVAALRQQLINIGDGDPES